MRARLASSLAILCAVLLGACAAVTTRVVESNPAVRYPPTQNVEVLFEPPQRPHVQIAVLESEGDFGVTEPEILQSMRERAQALGADAIVRLETQHWYQPPMAVYDPFYDSFLLPRRYYAPYWVHGPPYGGYRLVGGGHYYTVKAAAIKYQPASGDPPAAAAPGKP